MTQPLQSALQQRIREALQCANDFNGDLHALANYYGIPETPISGRMIAIANKTDTGVSSASAALNYLEQNYERVVPTLALNFLGTTLDSRITFTRASSATMFDSSGTLVYAPMNLALQSENFADAVWTKTGSTIATDSTAAPNGALTADTIIEDTSTGQHLVGISSFGGVLVGQVFTLSCFVKVASGTRNVFLTAFGEGYSVFNTSTGAIVQTGGNNCTAFNIGNGWWRFTATITKTNTNAGFFVGLWSSSQTYAGDGTSGLFIWGAQVNRTPMQGGVTANLSTYYPTTTAAYQAPRLDYNPSTLAARGLLIEEQRVNSIRNNTMQGAVAGTPGTLPTNWGLFASNGLTTSVVSTGVSGGINYIDLRINGTTTSTFYVFAFDTVAASASAGQTWTESFWCSFVSGSTSNITSVGVNLRQVGGAGNTFDFIFAPTSTLTRYASTGTLTASATGVYAALSMFFNSGVAIDITLRIGLPQLELGAFATSVIPTTTTATTRSADVASVNTLSPWFNAAEGTLFLEWSCPSAVSFTGNREAANLSDNTYNNIVSLGHTAGGNVLGQLYTAGVANIYEATAPNLTVNKAGVAYITNSKVYVANGTVKQSNTSAGVPTLTQLGIGNPSNNGALKLCGWVRRVSYYPRRLSNAELQAITT